MLSRKTIVTALAATATVVIASALPPVSAQAARGLKNADGTCTNGMVASQITSIGSNGHVYSCSFSTKIGCGGAEYCPPRFCLSNYTASDWNYVTIPSPAVGTPPITFAQSYVCWGE